MLSAWIVESNLHTIRKTCVLGSPSILRAACKISPAKHHAAAIWNRSSIHLPIKYSRKEGARCCGGAGTRVALRGIFGGDVWNDLRLEFQPGYFPVM